MTLQSPSTGAIVPGSRRSTGAFLLLLLAYAFLLAGYVGLRYAWRSLDGDAVSLTRLSQSVFAEGTISPVGGGYPYGPAYPVLNTFLAHATGAPIVWLQTYVQPFLAVLLVPAAYAAYRSLTGSGPVALLASLLLFLSPEFLFEATRSSHAKVTWLLALTMLFVLSRSFQAGRSFGRLAVWVVSFYLATFALISSNAFFASGYVFAITFAFVASYVLLNLRRTRITLTAQMRRLAYVTISSLVLVFLFIFYLYPPARSAFGTLQSTLDRVAVFFLSIEPASAANPYAYTQRTWLSLGVYLGLTSFNWIVSLLSFAVWIRKGWLLWGRRESLPTHQLLLWLLYASFGILMVISVLVDLSGALSANLQLRVFPHFLLVGIPLAGEGVVALVGPARRFRGRIARAAAPALIVMLISLFSLASLLKITSEPLLSHGWTFYASEEQQSVQWVGGHVRNNQVWLGQDVRLQTLVAAFGNWSLGRVGVDRAPAPVSSRYTLLSDISRMRADRLGSALPDIRQHNKVYDAGGAALYYSRPQTPYQR